MDESSIVAALGGGGIMVGLVEIIKMLIGKIKPAAQQECALAKERYDVLKEGISEVREESKEINKSMNSLVLTQERFVSKLESVIERGVK